MDTSPEYVKMCSEANEIQNEYWSRPGAGGIQSFFHALPNKRGGQTNIFLPRQDQLQAMLDYNIYDDRFPKFVQGDAFYQGAIKWQSFEQLWLAFVMKEKYSKTWDAEKQEWRAS